MIKVLKFKKMGGDELPRRNGRGKNRGKGEEIKRGERFEKKAKRDRNIAIGLLYLSIISSTLCGYFICLTICRKG